MKLSRDELRQCLRDLEVDEGELRKVRRGDRVALERIRQVARKAFRRLALTLHPDLNGGCAASTERFMRLRFVLDEWLERLTAGRRPVRAEDWNRHEEAVQRAGAQGFGMRDFIADAIRPGIEEAIRQHRRGAERVKVTTMDGVVVDVEVLWGLLEQD